MNTQMKTFNSSTRRIRFATCLSTLCVIALSTQAATITVMNGNDSGVGSLRQAIANAHNGDTINFDAALNVIGLWSGELVVDKSVAISGPGAANLILDGNQRGRLFHIIDGVTVSISGLTTTSGLADDRGNAILNDHSTLTLRDCIIGENILSSEKGGAICNDGASAIMV